MPHIYEIYADEAWTQGGNPLHRYWCFYGGILGSQPAVDRLDTALAAVIAQHGINAEVKWSSLNAVNLAAYKALVDTLFDRIRNDDLRYRQMFLDRSYVWMPEHGQQQLRDIDVQCKLYYQFLKHASGLRHIPQAPAGETSQVFVRLDNHSSQNHKDQLLAFAESLPRMLERRDLDVEVTFINSSKSRRLQICDAMMGAAGSYGNKMHSKRLHRKRGMSDKQKLRLELCQHIYNHLRRLDAEERGSKAFNWFETTGLQGDLRNRFH